MFQTIGMNVDALAYNKKNFTLWDIGGDKPLRNLWSKYYKESNAIVFVIDIQKEDRFVECVEEIHAVLAHPNTKDIPFLIVANKIDLCPSAADNCTHLLSKLGEFHSILQVSAKTGGGLNSLLLWLCDRASIPSDF